MILGFQKGCRIVILHSGLCSKRENRVPLSIKIFRRSNILLYGEMTHCRLKKILLGSCMCISEQKNCLLELLLHMENNKSLTKLTL